MSPPSVKDSSPTQVLPARRSSHTSSLRQQAATSPVQNTARNSVDSKHGDVHSHSQIAGFMWTAGCGTACINKQPHEITYISHEWHNLNYSNLQHLLSRDITLDSEIFIHMFGWKQKLQLSKLKSAILQLNAHYYHDCSTG